MGSQGGAGPNGLRQREAKTLFLRAPYHDWAALSQGYKTEFRTPPMGAVTRALVTPTPVVLYSVTPTLKDLRKKLMVLDAHHGERLMDIADDAGALMREGFDDYDTFRRYWRKRTHRPYRPLAFCEVWRVRPWLGDQDHVRLGVGLLTRLYGEYLVPN